MHIFQAIVLGQLAVVCYFVFQFHKRHPHILAKLTLAGAGLALVATILQILLIRSINMGWQGSHAHHSMNSVEYCQAGIFLGYLIWTTAIAILLYQIKDQLRTPAPTPPGNQPDES